MSHSFIQICFCITASFSASRMNSMDIFTSLMLLMLTMLPCLINSKQTVFSNQCLCWSTRLKVIMTQDTTPKRGCRWPVVDNPHRSRLTRCPSHDWSSIARVAHPVDRFWEWWSSTPWKYVGRVRVCFDPLKMSHSFIQNCCCITASFTASRMNSWTLSLHLHWCCLCWRCYHPYVWSAPSRQCPPINVYAAILDLKVIVAQGKTPKRGCRWPAVDNPHRWCNSWSRRVHLPWQYKGVLMATVDWMFYAALDLPVYRQDAAKRQTAGIVFTHRPKIRFFAPQGRLVAPIQVKLCSTDGPPGSAWLCKISRQSVQTGGNATPKISKISTFW